MIRIPLVPSRFVRSPRGLRRASETPVLRIRDFWYVLSQWSALLPRPMNHQVRVLANERLRHMAAPADGQVPRELFRQPLRRNSIPFRSFQLPIEQRGAMIEMADLIDRLPAIHALLPCIPVRGDRPHAMIHRISFDLLETGLIAIRPLRPARTVAQSELVTASYCHQRSAQDVHFDCRRLMCFRTGDQHFAVEFETCPCSPGRIDDGNGEQCYEKICLSDHDVLPAGSTLASRRRLHKNDRPRQGPRLGATSPSRVPCVTRHGIRKPTPSMEPAHLGNRGHIRP